MYLRGSGYRENQGIERRSGIIALDISAAISPWLHAVETTNRQQQTTINKQ